MKAKDLSDPSLQTFIDFTDKLVTKSRIKLSDIQDSLENLKSDFKKLTTSYSESPNITSTELLQKFWDF